MKSWLLLYKVLPVNDYDFRFYTLLGDSTLIN